MRGYLVMKTILSHLKEWCENRWPHPQSGTPWGAHSLTMVPSTVMIWCLCGAEQQAKGEAGTNCVRFQKSQSQLSNSSDHSQTQRWMWWFRCVFPPRGYQHWEVQRTVKWWGLVGGSEVMGVWAWEYPVFHLPGSVLSFSLHPFLSSPPLSPFHPPSFCSPWSEIKPLSDGD